MIPAGLRRLFRPAGDFAGPVDFLVCGAQKGGTSALDAYLRRHERIVMADVKEVHYFDTDRRFARDTPDYADYHAHFPGVQPGTVVGESTPIYLYWDGALERIRDYHPGIRLIAALRNPLTRAYSHWNMEASRGLEEQSFSEAIRAEARRLGEGSRQHRVASYLDRGRYLGQLERLYALFPAEQVLLIKSETLRQDPHGELERVYDFLGVGPGPAFEAEPVHARDYTAPVSAGDKRFLHDFFDDEIRALEAYLGWDLSDWLAW